MGPARAPVAASRRDAARVALPRGQPSESRTAARAPPPLCVDWRQSRAGTEAVSAGIMDDVGRSPSATNADSAARRAAAAASAGSGEATGQGVAPSDVGLPSDEETRAALDKIMREIQDPEFKKTLGETLGSMGRSDDAGGMGLFGGLDGADGGEMDGNVTKTMEMLQKLAATSDGGEDARKVADDVMAGMTAEFEAMGQKEDFQAVVDNMMRQLLARDVMYEPMKQICELYPAWMAEHVDSLSKTEYENYGRQYQLFQKLVAAYETEPDNFPRLMELMHDLQETGQPPREIVTKLAPGLDVGADGLPTIPSMGEGVPAMPGMPAGACAVM